MRNAAILLLMLTTVGCVELRTEVVLTKSIAAFSPAERREVWGRAVVAFNNEGLLIASANADSGVLRTEVQPGWASCENSQHYVGTRSTTTGANHRAAEAPARICRETRFSQFTMGDQGTAVLRVHRAVHAMSSEDKFLTVHELSEMQREVDELLLYIVGASKQAPEPTKPVTPKEGLTDI
jgi:hypothetical protein